ncbi:hypothetical protein PR003_g32547 [Phytophthora rubi]|uniref:RxLR effector protein n=1 Tax=Phytophthora rubi TaxID=129364 RepID=A0A6A4B1B7_9STRA|nr:hypothetical protein PR002_g30159 [Phytophthora rubi]KAE8960659.1 hypothetical protein PR001_g30315 [Phytophthora rubi]KAE9265152.1 hypothetical protein PR003_g32547 [Phytophthora rubi]
MFNCEKIFAMCIAAVALSSGVHAETEAAQTLVGGPGISVGVPGIVNVGVGGAYGPGVVGPAVGVGVPGIVNVGVGGHGVGGAVVNGGYPSANGGASASATANANRKLRSVQ